MRLALRTISRNPWFSALCVCSLAAGIGLTAALASVADAILFRPLPVPRPQEIVRIFTASTGQPRGFVSFRDFEDFRRSARMLSGIAAQTQVLAAVGGDGSSPPTIRLGLAVSIDYFDVLGVAAASGEPSAGMNGISRWWCSRTRSPLTVTLSARRFALAARRSWSSASRPRASVSIDSCTKVSTCRWGFTNPEFWRAAAVRWRIADADICRSTNGCRQARF